MLAGLVGLLVTTGQPPALDLRSRAVPRAGRTAGGADIGEPTVIPIPISDRVPPRLPVEGVPTGWDLHEFAGRGFVELVRDGGRVAVRLRSENASFALSHDAVVDLHETPILSWAWKAVRLPDGGDVREAARDDQVAQVYVIFPQWPSPRTQSDVIGYVWDTRAPVGTRLASPKAANVRIIVVDSGAAEVGTWRTHHRNVAEDYVALFGREPPRVGGVGIMIDSDDTRGEAEALVADLRFSQTPP